MIFSFFLSLKAGCLPFYNLLHYYDSIFQKLVLCQKVLMYLEVFLWTERKTERFRYDFKEKTKISEISEFTILSLYPSSKTGKSRKFRLPQIMTLIVIQDLKTPIETKTKRFQYDLEQNGKFPRFPSFWFCSVPKIENSEISEDYILIEISTG